MLWVKWLFYFLCFREMSEVDITDLVGCRKKSFSIQLPMQIRLRLSIWDLSLQKDKVKWASVNVFILVLSLVLRAGPETQACSDLFSEVSVCMCRYKIHLHTTIRSFPCKYKISLLFYVHFCIYSCNIKHILSFLYCMSEQLFDLCNGASSIGNLFMFTM